MPPYSIRWQDLQPRPSQSQYKGTQGSRQEHAVCWWRSSCDPHPGGTPVIDGLLLTGLRTSDWPSVWKRRKSWDRIPKHCRSLPSTTMNSMLSASSSTSASSSRTTSPWTQRWTRWLGNTVNSRPAHGSSVDKPQAVCEDKDCSLHCLCYQHIAVWQRDMTYVIARHDYVCRAGEKAQHIPPEKHPSYPGNILAGQSNLRWCPVSCWSSQYAHSA